MDQKILAGKVAVITGAGQGIGRAEAHLLAANGASIIVNDMGCDADGQKIADIVVNEIEENGGKAVANYADVSDWSAAEAMIMQAIKAYGCLDILICNAGIVRDRMLHNISESEFDDVIRVHMKGHFAPTKFASIYWRDESRAGRQRNARIIYTTSEAGLYGHMGQTNYSAAKAGIVGMGLTAARELERFGVTVNSIAPRGRTQMTELALGKFKSNNQFDEWDPENVPPLVAFLSSDYAAAISGQVFVVYGGTVSVHSTWPRAGVLQKDGRWTVNELLESAEELFPGLNGPIPPFPQMEIPV